MELSRLRTENLRLKRELEIIKSGGVLREGCAVKYAYVDAQGQLFRLSEMCNVLDVGVCGYRAWKRRGTTDSKHTQPVADNL